MVALFIAILTVIIVFAVVFFKGIKDGLKH